MAGFKNLKTFLSSFLFFISPIGLGGFWSAFFKNAQRRKDFRLAIFAKNCPKAP